MIEETLNKWKRKLIIEWMAETSECYACGIKKQNKNLYIENSLGKEIKVCKKCRSFFK